MKGTKLLSAPVRTLESLGHQVAFHGRAYGLAPMTFARYKREIIRQLAAVSFGTGGLALVGGTAVIVGFMTASTGVEVAIQGYTALNNVGVEVLTGFVSAYVNTRIAAPAIAAVALVATVGAGITAELGARRISEEIDALEVMAVPPVPYLVTTRIIAGLLSITPLYAVALFVSFGMTKLTSVVFYGLSAGSYDHYFSTFLVPSDILSSYLQVLAMSVVIVSVHCYYGFHAAGGPAGVGDAVGRSVRLSLILVLFTIFALTLVLYGNTDTLRISR
jgi:phospholipid/cholesterol/gamma-HCH transport system permease protein